MFFRVRTANNNYAVVDGGGGGALETATKDEAAPATAFLTAPAEGGDMTVITTPTEAGDAAAAAATRGEDLVAAATRGEDLVAAATRGEDLDLDNPLLLLKCTSTCTCICTAPFSKPCCK
jgi:hypothetical protein